jgi:hypothetical protein
MTAKILRTIQRFGLIVVFLASALVMFVYELVKETFFHGLFTAWESHYATILVTSVIATVATHLVRNEVRRVVEAESTVLIETRKLNARRLMFNAVRHVVGNFLNKFTLIEAEIIATETITPNTMTLLKEGMDEVIEQIKLLEEIPDVANADHYPEEFKHPRI